MIAAKPQQWDFSAVDTSVVDAEHEVADRRGWA